MTKELQFKKAIPSGSLWATPAELAKNSFPLSELNSMVRRGDVVYHKALSDNDCDCFSVPEYHIAENEVAENVVRIVTAPCRRYSQEFLDVIIKKATSKLGISLHEEQYNGVLIALQSSMMILTGGPGMGKTCVLNVLRECIVMLDPNARITFLAPTGKAAERISEATSQPAFTINKKIAVWENHWTPTPLTETDVLICDEFSMADIVTSAALFKAIQTGTRVILVGDVDQLPSVGAGAVLRDLIASERVPVVALSKTFRQTDESYVRLNSQKIKFGNSNFTEGSDFHILRSNSFKESAELMEREYLRYVARYGVDNVACLVPFNCKGEASAKAMNTRLQKIINPETPEKKEITYYDTVFRKGDVVMQLKNRKECVNGDVGKIFSISNDMITVKFCNNTVLYFRSQLSQLTLAYAMTIHKSQGSEYKAVVTCLNTDHKCMLVRNLFYTAVTRAKIDCSLIGDQKAFTTAVKTVEADDRRSLLVDKIQYYYRKHLFTKA